MNFQMFKLDLEKAEEQEIKLPSSVGSLKNQESSRKTSTSASLTMLKPLTVWIITKFEKLLKRWEYQTILPISQETCMWVRKQQLEPFMEKLIGSNIEKGVQQSCLLTPCLFNLYAEHIMRNAGLHELQPGIKTVGRNINNLRNMDIIILMAESEEELKSLL